MDTTPKMNSPKVNINALTPQEARLYRLYGRVPSQSHHFAKHLKERKYFDSGDYALSKAGRADTVVGSLHPVPQNIPHPRSFSLASSPASSPTGTVMPSFSRSGSFSSSGPESPGEVVNRHAPSTPRSGAGAST
ncbi:camp-regulated phosphoprotein/endosulfine conserved region-domain-containing protein [Rhypophila decipiens]|uniref:mRNA stability protein n=1 Tax=Rhypophila decipiens TaxID=261697 RepID=A0AAN7BEG2_9PEZI|nr:camp-regulated phosphoprotein/endosulfine conserved region-domain-containing protein [Rhypophila decipiens]